MQEKVTATGTTSSVPSDQVLKNYVGIDTSSFVLGLLLIFLAASFAHSWADRQRKSRVHRALYRVLIVGISLVCACLLVYNYQGIK